MPSKTFLQLPIQFCYTNNFNPGVYSVNQNKKITIRSLIIINKYKFKSSNGDTLVDKFVLVKLNKYL